MRARWRDAVERLRVFECRLGPDAYLELAGWLEAVAPERFRDTQRWLGMDDLGLQCARFEADGRSGAIEMPVEQLLADYQPDAVLNFAAESHVDRSIEGPLAFVETNVVGTVRLLQTCREYWSELDEERQAAFRFLHVSTDEVYGSLGDTGLFKETTAYAPKSRLRRPQSKLRVSMEMLMEYPFLSLKMCSLV